MKSALTNPLEPLATAIKGISFDSYIHIRHLIFYSSQKGVRTGRYTKTPSR